jgi:hypothetical protein
MAGSSSPTAPNDSNYVEIAADGCPFVGLAENRGWKPLTPLRTSLMRIIMLFDKGYNRLIERFRDFPVQPVTALFKNQQC